MRNLHDDTIKSSTNAVTNTDIGNVTANGNYATKSLDNYGDLMSVADLAMFLGVSKQTVYSEIRQGKFGLPLKFGRSYRVPKVYVAQRYLGGYGDCCAKPS